MTEGFLILTGVLVVLLLIFARTNHVVKKRGWKIKSSGDSKKMYAELSSENAWRSITFEWKMYAKGVTRHAIIIDKDWSCYPKWAQERRDEILSRLKSELKEPTYTFIEKD